MKLVIPIFHTKFDPLHVFAIWSKNFGAKIRAKPGWTDWLDKEPALISLLFFFLYTYISVKELNGLDQKLLQFLDAYISFKEPSGLDTSV